MKGFTLIELLGVIIILGIISLVTIPVVTDILKDNTKTLYENQINNIEESTRNFVAENILKLDLSLDSKLGITVGKLKELGYLESSVINPKTKEDFNDNTTVIIENDNGNIEYTVCVQIECNFDELRYYGE